MKYPQLVSMPSEISDWLEQQLEARGIDSAIYTRYILSLLYRDSADIISSYHNNQFKTYDKDLNRTRGGKRFRRSTVWLGGQSEADAEQLKRSAAVECLLSASDQDCGIETLVDELCEKLKEYKSGSVKAIEKTSNNNISTASVDDVSPLDLARQYYAAFPPLSNANNNAVRSPGTSVLTFVPQCCYTSPKKKGARRRNRSSSCGEKLYKKESEINKIRTNGKHKKYGNRSKNENGDNYNWNKLFSKNAMEKGDGNKENDYSSLGNWSDCKENEIYEDLPVDIIELLDSPSPHDYTVEMMNLANMKEVGNKSFIPSGTNITSSIWSVDAPREDGENNSETVLGFKFSSLTMDCKASRNIWSEVSEENRMLDTENNNYFTGEIKNHPWHISMEKWSEGSDCQTNILIKSLIKLNHNRERSSFTEVSPRNNRLPLSDNSVDFFSTRFNNFVDEKRDEEGENLLTSDSSHFRPIKVKKEVIENHHVARQYADGTSFVISSHLDKPNYKRSLSGYLYLESERGSPQKLKELSTNNVARAPQEFVLKFFIKQNDKACQTDNFEMESLSVMDVEMDNTQIVPCKKRNMSESEFYFPGDQDLLTDSKFGEEMSSDVWVFDRKSDASPDASMTEVMWKYDGEICARCNNGNEWKEGWAFPSPSEEQGRRDDSIWQLDKDSLRNIWKGGEFCTGCCCGTGKMQKMTISSNLQRSQLREDISQDGEQLLSDLSTLQKSYMDHLPVAEMSYDINELLTAVNDRKRRHSPAVKTCAGSGGVGTAIPPAQRGSWSIASSVKQDHLMHMNSVPVLHSVTL